ncbi:hypothetical protein Q6D67_20730 [Haliea sp. E1-2-M8]|uniref:type IV pilus modification PilV family protein n=1 Tax=Haliea sp. E1-2-M8 TaxID=3064706 RepID=UPI00271B4B76|nr:hypothetical protein [Haliea sp. E1-2-M8]MDO8864116.1 hypothetical protein [Haliea sp. E1-2-M8]
MKSNRLGHSGIGLIEVLITTVVIALGLLAVARFQVGVIGESRDNKAMVEARGYCESGIEDLRRLMSRTDFIAFQEDLNPVQEQFTGKSAVFTRTLEVENLPDPGVTTDDIAREKRVTATCSWADGQVVLQTVLSLHGANSSALAVGLGGGGGPAISPSLNAGASDDISEVVPLDPSDIGNVSPGDVVQIEGDYFVVQASGLNAAKSELCSDLNPVPSSFESGLRARRVDKDGYAGSESIELFEVVVGEGDGKDYCVPRVRFNGGVVVPIRGIVHSRISTKINDTYLPVDLFTLNVSESGAYCVFSPEPGATSSPYTCYVGGNCAYGPQGIDDSDVTQCPTTALTGVLENVGQGGWRGRVGLLNVANAGYNVCFSEEVVGPAATRDTARSYFSYNFGPNGTLGDSDDRSQGINKPYSCHDFLIVDGINSPQPAALSKECQQQAETVGGLKLASKSISRNINTGSYSNVYDPAVNVDSCSEIPGTQYTITGGLIDQVGNPPVVASDGASTWQCNVVSNAYACTFTTESGAVQISAQGGSSVPDPCIVTLDPLNPDGTGCTFTFEPSTDPTYRISGFIYGDAPGTELSPSGGLLALGALYNDADVGCSVGNYLVGGREYECVFVVPETSPLPQVSLYAHTVAEYALAFEGGQKNVDLNTYIGETPREVAGPDLTVTPVATYQLSGTISVQGIGGGETLTPAVNPENSLGCTGPTPGGELKQTDSATYTCTIPAGVQSVTYSISPACSKAKKNSPGTKYLMTSGTNSSDAGSLPIDLNVNANQTVNVTIGLTNPAIPCG